MNERVKAKIAEWIDTDVLAEAIAAHIRDLGCRVSEHNCKAVWYDFLQGELHSGLERSAEAQKDLGFETEE